MKDVGRIGDMSPSANIRVTIDNDGDIIVSVNNEDGRASVEFCTGYAGGGKSPKVREALLALYAAIEEDNKLDPSRDWWSKRRVNL